MKQLAILYAYGVFAKYVVRYGKPGFLEEICHHDQYFFDGRINFLFQGSKLINGYPFIPPKSGVKV